MSRRHPATWRRYGVAVLATTISTVVRAVYAWYFPDVPLQFAVFYPALAVAAIYGGIGPGLLSLTLSLAAGWFLLTPGVHGGSAYLLVTLLTFTTVGGMVIALTASLAAAQRRSEAALGEARAARRQHEDVLRRLEAAHRQAAERAQELQTLFDVAPVGISLAHDPACEVVTSSPGLAVMLGTSPDSNVSMSQPGADALPFQLLSSDGQVIAARDLPMQMAARTRQVVTNYEYDVAFADGQRRRWLTNAAPLFNVDGTVRGVVAVTIDISARREMEEALRLALDRLDAHFDNSPLGAVEWDADFRVTHWSHGAERILGWTAAEAVGKGIDSVPIVHPDDWDEVVTLIRDMQATRRPRNMNRNRNVRKDGTVIVCDWYNSAIFDKAGRLVSVLSLVLDVTERQRAEQERAALLAAAQAAREQAERANAAKDDFLAMLSHELRAPMQSVLGWVRVFERSLLDPDLQARAVRTIDRNVRQQSQLINDMLDVSRIVAGKLSIERSDLHLSSLVEQTVEELAPELHDKPLRLDVSIAPNLYVVGDHERIHQVLTNVIGNAVKFTPPGGRVGVSCAGASGTAVVEVSDTGVGIDPDLMDQIFDRFRQGDTSSTRRHEGLGLGLTIAKHIVEQHGGTISAVSGGPGAGATFTIRLPLAVPSTRPVQPGAPDASEVDLSGVDVLVVDDHADTLELLAFIIGTAGARTRCAASATQAIALYRARRPHVVISDLSMPDMDGFHMLAALRTIEGPRVPALALTGLADATTQGRALAHGFDGHLAKPVDPRTLLGAIRDLLTARPDPSETPARS